jgi:hypothetical protein
LSLLFTVVSKEGDVDFEKIYGNEGVFIANVFDHTEIEKVMQSKEESSFKQAFK